MSPLRPSIADKRRRFHELHASGCFVIPNPWDRGSARWLQGLGFPALASTSSGFAWSVARPDNGITRDQALQHLTELVAGTGEGGFSGDGGRAIDARLSWPADTLLLDDGTLLVADMQNGRVRSIGGAATP